MVAVRDQQPSRRRLIHARPHPRTAMLTLSTRTLFLSLLAVTPLSAQEDEQPSRSMIVEPTSLELQVGETAQLNVQVMDADGAPEDVRLVYFTRSRGAVIVNSEGKVTAMKPGEFTMTVRTARDAGERVSVDIPVFVAYAELDAIEFEGLPTTLYTGAAVSFDVRVLDAIGFERLDLPPRISTSDASVAEIDEFGRLIAKGAGNCAVEAAVEGMTETFDLTVVANPVRTMTLSVPTTQARTGDVLQFTARALDADGGEVSEAPITYSFTAAPDDALGQSATGQIEQDGRFVAQDPGLYTIHASCGGVTASKTVRADERESQRRIKLVGRGSVSDVHTSDLWIFEGVDGRDYAVTGTWGANGDTIFWDV